MIIAKSVLAEHLGITRGRVSQLVAEGLPTMPDGQLDASAAAAWVLATLRGPQAGPTRDAARVLMAQACAWTVAASIVGRTPVAAVLAAAHAGLHRDQAEKLANLTMLFAAVAINDDMAEVGLPEVALPHPTEWPARIAWETLFDETGAARPEAAALA